MKLKGGTHFLLLRVTEDGQECLVDVHRSFSRAMKKWQHGSRISPIFSLDGASMPQFSRREKSWAIFVGPVYPGLLSKYSFSRAFLTLGLFNLLVICSNQTERDALKRLAKDQNLSWEEWELKKNSIVEVDFKTAGEF